MSEKTSDKRLLPCPFCGSDNVGIWHNYMLRHRFEVHCYDCHFGLAQSDTEEKAIKAWNTRKPMERILERLEEMKMRYFLTIANTGDEKLDAIYEEIGNAIDKAIEITKEEGGVWQK